MNNLGDQDQNEVTVEQRVRDMLERAGVEGAQSMSSGDLVELANLLAERDKLKRELDEIREDALDGPR